MLQSTSAIDDLTKGNCPDMAPKYKRVYARDLVEVDDEEAGEEPEVDEPLEEQPEEVEKDESHLLVSKCENLDSPKPIQKVVP